MLTLSFYAAKIIGTVIYVILYIIFFRESELVIPPSILDYPKEFWGYRWFLFWIGIKAALLWGLIVLPTIFIPLNNGKPLIVLTQ